jgi:hypothetical protein
MRYLKFSPGQPAEKEIFIQEEFLERVRGVNQEMKTKRGWRNEI